MRASSPGVREVGVCYNSSETVNKIRLLKYVLQRLRTDKLYLLQKKSCKVVKFTLNNIILPSTVKQ